MIKSMWKVAFLGLLAAGSSVVGGCANDSNSAPTAADDNTGEVKLALTQSGLTFTNASYTISGPASFMKAGSINLTNGVISGLIGGIPTGAGYSITLDATATGGAVNCNGTANFDIVAHQTTPVVVPLVCRESVTGGSVSVSDTTNICPVVDGVLATPSSATVSTSVAITSTAHDMDMGPMPLSYHWTATAGTFSDPNVQNPTFTCPATAATVTLTLTVADGGPSCTDTMSLTVDCTP
jgi:hypothetical protein